MKRCPQFNSPRGTHALVALGGLLALLALGGGACSGGDGDAGGAQGGSSAQAGGAGQGGGGAGGGGNGAGGSLGLGGAAGGMHQCTPSGSILAVPAQACQYLVPSPPDGKSIVDYDWAIVLYGDGSGMDLEIPIADSEADCGDGPGYYINRAWKGQPPPDLLSLCPATCGVVQGAPGGQIYVSFVCGTGIP